MFLIKRRDDGGSEYVTGGMKLGLTPLPSTTDVSFVYNTPTPFVTLHSSSSSNFQTNFARSRQLKYRCCDSLLCSAPLLMVYNVTPLGTMGASTPLVWTVPCPWRPPNVLLRSSREHFGEMFLIRTRDDRGSEDRSCIIDNGCFELVERCKCVTGGMKFDLTPLPSTTDVSFVYNTPTPFVTHCSSSSSNFLMNFARSRPSRYR